MEVSKEKVIELGKLVCDESAPMARRMRAVFTLRNLGGNESVDALRPCKLNIIRIILKNTFRNVDQIRFLIF